MNREASTRLVMLHAAALTEWHALTAAAKREPDPNRADQHRDNAADRLADARALEAALAELGVDVECPPPGQLALMGIGL